MPPPGSDAAALVGTAGAALVAFGEAPAAAAAMARPKGLFPPAPKMNGLAPVVLATSVGERNELSLIKIGLSATGLDRAARSGDAQVRVVGRAATRPGRRLELAQIERGIENVERLRRAVTRQARRHTSRLPHLVHAGEREVGPCPREAAEWGRVHGAEHRRQPRVTELLLVLTERRRCESGGCTGNRRPRCRRAARSACTAALSSDSRLRMCSPTHRAIVEVGRLQTVESGTPRCRRIDLHRRPFGAALRTCETVKLGVQLCVAQIDETVQELPLPYRRTPDELRGAGSTAW